MRDNPVRVYQERWPSGVVSEIRIFHDEVHYIVFDVSSEPTWSEIVTQVGVSGQKLRRRAASTQNRVAGKLDLERTRQLIATEQHST